MCRRKQNRSYNWKRVLHHCRTLHWRQLCICASKKILTIPIMSVDLCIWSGIGDRGSGIQLVRNIEKLESYCNCILEVSTVRNVHMRIRFEMRTKSMIIAYFNISKIYFSRYKIIQGSLLNLEWERANFTRM